MADEERPTSTTADAASSAESVGNSSFGEDSSATPVPIGQQKATAILPEVHPVTGELDTTTVTILRSHGV